MSFKSLKYCFHSIISLCIGYFLLGANLSYGQMGQNLFMVNPKAISLGNAVTADPPGIDSIHFNPAGLARLKGRQYLLKGAIGIADIKGKFTVSDEYEEVLDQLSDEARAGIVDPAANSESSIDSFAVYLPGVGITPIPFTGGGPLGGASIQPAGSKMTFATAVYPSFLLGVVRDDDDPGRFAGKKLAITRLTFFSPSVGYQLTDTIALGASVGFSYMGFGLELDYRANNGFMGGVYELVEDACNSGGGINNLVNLCEGSISPFDELFNLQVDVDKMVSITFNFGVLWEITPWLTWGLAYQSEAKDRMEGTIALDFSPNLVAFYGGVADGAQEGFTGLDSFTKYIIDGLLGLPANGLVESDAALELTLPQHLSTGISLMLTPRLKVNVDVKWTETSKWEAFSFEILDTIQALDFIGQFGIEGISGNNITFPRGYEDTINWGIGAEYALTDELKLRAGYEPRKAGIPDDKLDFLVPLGDMDLFSVGASYALDSYSNVDVAFAYAKSHQKIPVGSSDNGNKITNDDFVYQPYAGLHTESIIEIILLEISYESSF
ncbi:MAG: hypothetical protein COA99_04185 [Moraxellaceae bacterium]|nr:MAG: hypothetical protein COA99_04185 [Moraxellaceae bacterium]